MSTTIPQAASVAAHARLVNCPHCWQVPGRPCTFTNPAGDHLARYQRAERRGLIDREDLAAVVAGLEVVAGHVIVRQPTQVKLDGCTCVGVGDTGAHRRGCPWSMK